MSSGRGTAGRPRRLDGRGSRLDQRRARQRSGDPRPAVAASGRSCRARLDRDRLRTWMNTLEPVSVALKFGFLAMLYLFLLWVVRSARRDLRAGAPLGAELGQDARTIPPDATGLYSASARGSADIAHRAPRLVVERAPGHDPGMIYDLDGDIVLGRGDRAEIRLDDPFASSRHAHIYEQGN